MSSVTARRWRWGLFDPRRNDVTFAGFARGIGGDGARGSRERAIARAVSRIFDHYPARPAPSDDIDAGPLDAGPPDAGALPSADGAADAGPAGDAGARDAGTGDAGPLP